MEETCEISLSELDLKEKKEDVESQVISCLQPELVAEAENDLAEKLKEFQSTITKLQDDLLRKTDVISELEKNKGSLEKEVTNVSLDVISVRTQ